MRIGLNIMLTDFKQGRQLLPQLRQRPTVLMGWLRPFHWMQVAVPAILLVLVLASPVASHSLVDSLYPGQHQFYASTTHISEHIACYNNEHLHDSLDYRSPEKYEKLCA